MYFLLCPDFVEKSSENFNSFGNSILCTISNRMSIFKIHIDMNNTLIEKYGEIAKKDKTGFIKVWLDSIINNNCYNKVNISLTGQNIYEDSINLLKKTLINRNIIVDSELCYELFAEDILSHSINILLAEDAEKILNKPESLDINIQDKILEHLLITLSNMTEKKYGQKLEDLHNDMVSLALKNFGFNVAEQERGGKSGDGENLGELDILIRTSMNKPVSIIEAFRLQSCGSSNSIISSHIDKLLNNYDTNGYTRNFVIVYSETTDFNNNWSNYINYMNNLNSKPDFSDKCPLISFSDTYDTFSKFTDIRIGRGTHLRNGREIEVIHIFCNFNN